MHDDTDFDFDVSPAPAADNTSQNQPAESPPASVPMAADASQPAASGDPATPTHHIHTRSGTVTIVGRDVMAALIEALSEVHRRNQ